MTTCNSATDFMPPRSLRSILSQAARISLPLLALATISPTARAAFDISFNFSANTTAEQQAYFNEAAAYWESQISGYKDGVNLQGLTINADVTYIDGAYGTLGSAGPSQTTRQGNTLYATRGSMQFDSADVDRMIANGTFADVIRHEMGHVLGIGTLWESNGLYADGTGTYTGANGLAAWRSEFNQPDAASAPVELGGGGGTRDGHWNENESGAGDTGFVSKYSVGKDFRYELMTGWANSPAFTSSVTLGSLIDMGYTLRIPTDANGDYLLSVGRVFTGLNDDGGVRSMRKITGDGVALAAAGNFSGGSSIEAGTLYVEHINALGTGPVTVAGGTLDVGSYGVAGIGALTLQSGFINGTTGVITAASYTVKSGVVAAILAGNGALTKDTTGTVLLSGQNTYTGATNVNAGTLLVSGSLGDTTVTVASGAVFGGKGTIGTGGASVNFAGGSVFLGDTTGAMTVNGAVNVASGARIDLNGPAVTGTRYVILTATGASAGLNNFTTLFRGVVDTSVANQVAVTAQASVPLTWTGATDGNWGVVDAKNNFKRTTGGITDNFYQGDAVAFTDAGIQKTITLNGRLRAGDITVSNETGTYTFNGAGYLAGSGGLTKTGAGTLVINTDNSFTGKTALTGGVTQIASDAALGAAPDAFVADQLTLDGGTLKAGANLTLSANRGITLFSPGTLDTNGFTVNYAGVIAGGSNAFVKNGAGTLSLSGLNTYTGGTTVNAGVLDLAAGGSTGAIRGGITVNSGATLRLSAEDALGYSQYLRAGNLNLNGGTLDVQNTGDNSLTSQTITFTGGTMTGGAGSKFDLRNNGAGNSNISTNASSKTSVISVGTLGLAGGDTTLTVAKGTAASGIDLSITSKIVNDAGSGGSGPGTHKITKTGAGTLKLSGANTFTGGVAIDAGKLIAANTAALGAGNVSVANAATLQIGDGTTNGVTLGASATLAMATGSTLKLGGADAKITMGASGIFTLFDGVKLDITGVSLGAGSYTLISGTATGSQVGTWSAANLIGGDTANYNYALLLSGTNAVFNVTAIPEPATYGLLGAGSLALVALVRRRRKPAR